MTNQVMHKIQEIIVKPQQTNAKGILKEIETKKKKRSYSPMVTSYILKLLVFNSTLTSYFNNGEK